MQHSSCAKWRMVHDVHHNSWGLLWDVRLWQISKQSAEYIRVGICGNTAAPILPHYGLIWTQTGWIPSSQYHWWQTLDAAVHRMMRLLTSRALCCHPVQLLVLSVCHRHSLTQRQQICYPVWDSNATSLTRVQYSIHVCHCCCYYYYNHFTALWTLSGTTRVSRYQKKHSPTRHLLWWSIIPYLHPPSFMIHGILLVQFTCLTVFFHNLSQHSTEQFW